MHLDYTIFKDNRHSLLWNMPSYKQRSIPGRIDHGESDTLSCFFGNYLQH
uniref:Uncharacterized protein n=1 Tax=Arundo donax TaxID=35708 RepID=A0A0A9PSU0_ARUDO